MSAKTPNPIDVYVGSRVRLQRMILRMSQEELANRLGLTFQQIQKYERGTNRISASKLYEISRILNAPISSFFNENNPAHPDVRDPMRMELMKRYAYTREGFELNKAFLKIKHRKTRRAIIALAEFLAKKTDDQIVEIPGDTEISRPHRKT